MPLRIEIIALLILVQLWLSTSQFVFELEVNLDSVTVNGNCDTRLNSGCETYFSVFCLREGREGSQSTNTEDCPLGRNTKRMNAYENDRPLNTRMITSQLETSWPVRPYFVG